MVPVVALLIGLAHAVAAHPAVTAIETMTEITTAHVLQSQATPVAKSRAPAQPSGACANAGDGDAAARCGSAA
jgi:hypothetical protein